MAIAHDANSTVQTTTNDTSWTHTPVGTPRGAVVRIIQTGTAGDRVAGVTYGGAAMARIVAVPLSSTESGYVYNYWLDNVAAGEQTVAVTMSTTAGVRVAVSSTYTVAGGATSSVDVSPSDAAASGANPTLTVPATTDVLVYYALWSGVGTVSTAVINGTHELNNAFGAQIGQWARKTASGSSTIGYTLADDEWAHAALAIKEVAGEAPAPSATAVPLGLGAPARGISIHGGLNIGGARR